MTLELTEIIDIFYCYAREDRMLRDKLEIHLGTLKQLGKITSGSTGNWLAKRRER